MKRILSIIIPVYNSEKTIERCLNSIIDSNYLHEYEIIIVNDGSTDASSHLCDTYTKQYENIKLIEQNNSGVSAARNMGIRLSEGSHIVFVDSDDYVEDNFIDEILKMINSGSSLILFNNFCVEKAKVIDKEYKGIIDDKHFLMQEIIQQKMNAPWGKIFKKSIITDNDIYFDEKLWLGEDYVFLLNYISHVDNIIYYNKPLYNYVKNIGSITNSKINIAKIKQFECMYNISSKIVKNMGENVEGFMVSNINVLFRLIVRLEDKYHSLNEVRRYFRNNSNIKELLSYKFNGRTAVKRFILKKLLF